ncbi:MAG TPA: MgtC/SapB family protein [Phycisphaerae bacterium]|nr:MgtC/SapB family protein [Phycisphaerales bacterium]HRX85411.1 MgtC/SapB family protein [Phycisphaerae bacterium]
MFELNITWWELAGRLLLAAVLGGVLGWDREAHNKPAGVRTFMIVALGSTGLALIADGLFEVMRREPQLYGGLDPSRILQGIIGGIGFIGAGTIIRGEAKVQGITTAAGIWLAAAVGIAVGLGSYSLAIALSALGVIVLAAVGFFTVRVLDQKDGPDD